MEDENKGFTTVELLTVVAIIALLIGMLIPALNAVRKSAKEAKQKAQFATIDLALTTFKNDYGDYPPSDAFSSNTRRRDYCGAQKLAEALLGWDLMGFHPKSAWSANGLDANNGPGTYDPGQVRDDNKDGVPDTLNERRGPYLELATANAFRLGVSGSGVRDGLFDKTTFRGVTLAPHAYVLCDAFAVPGREVVLPDGRAVTPGTPILYYKANASSKTISDPAAFDNRIYNIRDNGFLVALGRLIDGRPHPLWNPEVFYGNPAVTPPIIGYIQDSKVTARPWPYRPDSYLLISAGADGFYGTADDITNFGN